MTTTKTFDLADILSVTTGVLLSPVGGVYSILNWMTGDDLMTHQLPLAADAMTPELLLQHPWLKGLQPPKVAGLTALLAWLDRVVDAHGDLHEVAPAPLAWGRHDPISDFRNEYPGTPVLGVVVAPEEGL